MRKRSASSGRSAAAALTFAAAGTAVAGDGSLDFDRVFAASSGPSQRFYAATYAAGGVEHRVDVWRDGDERIRRRTDDTVETDLYRPPGSAEWTMSVLDLKRRIRTDIDRTNLLRIGHYTDWFAQAHVLTRPRAAYRLVAATPPAGSAPVAPCRWYRLSEADRTTTICWSAAAAVPLAIVDAHGTVVWRVTRLATGPFAASTFVIDDRGFVRHDAAQDIEPD